MTAQLAMFADCGPGPLRPPAEPILRQAVVDDGCRFLLLRAWATGPRVGICGLNPSTADGDDPTMRREMAYAARWGFGSLVKVNLYPAIATTPAGLEAWLRRRNGGDAAARRAHQRNIAVAADALGAAETLWVAWGAGANADDVFCFLAFVGGMIGRRTWLCLGTNADGSPRHTLARGRHRPGDDAVLEPWS